MLMVDLIYNLIIEKKKKKIPIQLVNEKEEGWVDINPNKEDNITIGYDYTPWRIPSYSTSNIENYVLKP